MDRRKLIENPYRPGAGQVPPFVSGRGQEMRNFQTFLHQGHITENILVTGLRGVGKTVLFDQFRKYAADNDWLVVGNDLSESSSLTEERLALRIITDLAATLAEHLDHGDNDGKSSPHGAPRLQGALKDHPSTFTFDALQRHYEQAPGLPSDRLREVLKRVTSLLQRSKFAGLILAYDEAQCLSDHSESGEFPMSLLVETVSQLQKQQGLSPVVLILCGLPHVLDALVATRTYTERMFQVMPLERLSTEDTRLALMTPLAALMPPLHAPLALLEKVVTLTGGYPYLIQFFGRELVNQLLDNGGTLTAEAFPSPATLERLDAGLFSARWSRTSDRQRELLCLIANRPGASDEFSVKELEQLGSAEGLTGANIQNLMLALCERGLVYRARHGRYAFTIPMSEAMITRRLRQEDGGHLNIHSDSLTGPAEQNLPPPPKVRRKGWFR